MIPLKRCDLTGRVLFNKYLVGSCIGFGSFGDVYLVYDIEAEQIYAMKSQQEKTKNPQLMNEARIIKQFSGEKGFEQFYHYGYQSKYNIVVMGLLGPSLEDLFNSCNRCFSLKTILMLAEQILTRIETFHSKNYVYRDIKPQNFLMGLHENSHVVHLVDYGLSKKFRDNKNHQHVPYRQNRSIVGTVRYCSVNSHLGLQYGRRDDLQSIGYMLQYFYKGCVPWQGLQANTNLQKYSKILEQKQNISVDHQCKGMPVEFATYMHYCKSLKYSERPDYTFLRKLFSDLFDRLNFQRDFVYDWCKLPHTMRFQNGTMSLTIRNKHSDLESEYATFMTSQKIDEEEITLNVIDQKKDKQQEQQQQQILLAEDDQNQGNIEENVLEDTGFKLISHRNKWYDNQL